MWTLNIYYTLHLQCVVLLSAGQVFFSRSTSLMFHESDSVFI